ncbi:MAG: hypothetical protein GY898_17670 [Proteobacteria bacterium]|nr:hypothetical protein [Pseudomonadota bacterium]
MRSRLLLLALVAAACGPTEDPFPAPDAWGGTTGPGGPTVEFTDADLGEHCAYLTGGPEDADHHNLQVMYDGYLLLPWAPENGGGGLTFFDFTDPCVPAKVGETYAEGMRETHSMAFGTVGGREYLAVDYHFGDVEPDGGDRGEDEEVEVEGGVGFWDITDKTDPQWVGELALPGYDYPDAYLRVTLSNFWQGDYVYASSGFGGIFIIDASDPADPQLVSQYQFTPNMLVGSFHVFGNRGVATSAGLTRMVLVDLDDPLDPQPVLGGDLLIDDSTGAEAPYYFANLGGPYALFARKDEGGGPILYDISDENRRPSFVGEAYTDDGSGGYVFLQEDHLFFGDSDFASIYDASDPTAPVEVLRLDLQGDLDTLTPVGNVAIASVDSGAVPGQSSAVIPWRTTLDRRGPRVGMTSPADGERGVASTGRVGLSFDEMIEPMSVFAGSFRVADPDGEPVPGQFNTQENLVNFTPDEDLLSDATYTVTVPAGGVTDVSGNVLEADVVFTFETAP